MFARLARPDTFDCTTSGTLGTFNFIVRLQVDPELMRRIEVPGQPQRGVDRDPASTSVHSYAVPLGASLYAGLAYDFLRFLSRSLKRHKALHYRYIIVYITPAPYGRRVNFS